MTLTETKQKAKSFFKRLLWILLISSIVFSGVYYFYRTYTVSEGTRTGTLYKISKKGKIFKTYEGQIQLAGSTIVSKASTWDFSVVDAETYVRLQEFEGKNVRLHYKEMVEAFPWQGDTDYLVFQVEEVK
ncbi:MAG: 6-phosphogluconate dehydrogenase [Saprospiraceae bacterium]|nr:6-phosphogluconate dehydrogenase [Saprospiraceae bacterium]